MKVRWDRIKRTSHGNFVQTFVVARGVFARSERDFRSTLSSARRSLDHARELAHSLAQLARLGGGVAEA